MAEVKPLAPHRKVIKQEYETFASAKSDVLYESL